MDVRTAAATTLGQIGPEAKEAIPALKRPFRDSDPRGVLPWPSEVDFYEAVYQALIRIGGAADAVATIRDDLKHARRPSWGSDNSDHDNVFKALLRLAKSVKEVSTLMAELVSDDTTVCHERLDGARCLGEIGPAAIETVPVLKNTLRSLERGGAKDRDSNYREIYDAVKEALTKIDPNWALAPAANAGATSSWEELKTSSSQPMKPPPPGRRNRASYQAPQGLREGVDRLLRRLEDNHELVGDFGDYTVQLPPAYTGSETEYEIGLLRSGSNFYVFRTVDGGQTWSLAPPTDPYLKKVAKQTRYERRRKATSGTSGADQSAGGPTAKVPLRPGDSSPAAPAGSPGYGPPRGHARPTKIAEIQPESDFLGEWTNRDFQTLGITRIQIIRARGSNRIVVRLWTKSKGPTGEWDHGDANAVLRNNVLSVNQTSLIDVDTMEMTLLENGDMQVDAHPRFSGRESVDHISGKSVFGKLATPGATPSADKEPRPKGPLTGTWKGSTGDEFRVVDDGTTATIELLSSDPHTSLSGKLTRGGKGPDAKSLTGNAMAVFPRDAPKQHSVRVTATLDDSGRLHLRCADMPIWNNAGRVSGTHARSEILTRTDGT